MTSSHCRKERAQGGTDQPVESNTHFPEIIQLGTLTTIRISIRTNHHPDIHQQDITVPTPRVAILIHYTHQEVHLQGDHRDTRLLITITISQIYTDLSLTMTVGDDIPVCFYLTFIQITGH
jgi:hypothetical protein